MSKTLVIILSLLAVLILIAAWYYLIYKPAQLISTEGNPCSIGGFPGKIKNGVCVKLGIGGGSVSF